MGETKKGKEPARVSVPLETENLTAWFNDEGQPHRLDGPAVMYKNNPTKIWYKNGKVHRDGDEPAYIYGDSGDTPLTFEWYQEGNLHRQGSRPAVLRANGTKEWWVDGEHHRVDGPAIERVDGTKEWWVGGELHRVDGPAIERADGTKEWWVGGELHRVDGPAIERADGTKEWWVNGKLSTSPKKCLNAVSTKTSKEKLVKLCMSEDYVVQSLVFANPNCPPEGKLIVILRQGGNLP